MWKLYTWEVFGNGDEERPKCLNFMFKFNRLSYSANHL